MLFQFHFRTEEGWGETAPPKRRNQGMHHHPKETSGKAAPKGGKGTGASCTTNKGEARGNKPASPKTWKSHHPKNVPFPPPSEWCCRLPFFLVGGAPFLLLLLLGGASIPCILGWCCSPSLCPGVWFCFSPPLLGVMLWALPLPPLLRFGGAALSPPSSGSCCLLTASLGRCRMSCCLTRSSH